MAPHRFALGRKVSRLREAADPASTFCNRACSRRGGSSSAKGTARRRLRHRSVRAPFGLRRWRPRCSTRTRTCRASAGRRAASALPAMIPITAQHIGAKVWLARSTAFHDVRRRGEYHQSLAVVGWFVGVVDRSGSMRSATRRRCSSEYTVPGSCGGNGSTSNARSRGRRYGGSFWCVWPQAPESVGLFGPFVFQNVFDRFRTELGEPSPHQSFDPSLPERLRLERFVRTAVLVPPVRLEIGRTPRARRSAVCAVPRA